MQSRWLVLIAVAVLACVPVLCFIADQKLLQDGASFTDRIIRVRRDDEAPPEEPPADAPPAEEAPAEAPPPEEAPPAEEAPAEAPPAEEAPAEAPPAEEAPPADAPPEAPPADENAVAVTPSSEADVHAQVNDISKKATEIANHVVALFQKLVEGVSSFVKNVTTTMG